MNEINESSNKANINWILDIIPNLLINDNNTRQKSEKILEDHKYDISLYKNLIENGLYNLNISDNIKLQIFILLKKLIKDNIISNLYQSNATNMRNEEYQKNIESIIDNLKLHLNSYLNKGEFTQIYNKIIRDIVCIISSKYFPYKWKELNDYYIEFFEFDFKKNISIKYFNASQFISSMFYTTLKNIYNDNKNKYNTNFEELKNYYTNSFLKYYNNIKDIFALYPNGIINDKVTQKCFKIMTKNDKILLLLIRLNFNKNHLNNESISFKLVKILLDRIKSILIMLENIKIEIFKILIQENLQKVFEYIAIVLTKDPLIFCFHIDQIILILSYLLKNCNLINIDTTKVVLFNLSKILSIQIYKESIESNLESATKIKNYDDITYVTPSRAKYNYSKSNNILKTKLDNLGSLYDYDNNNEEIYETNEIYKKCMPKENILDILESLINKVPFLYSNEIENTEIEILSHFQEENLINIYTFSKYNFTIESMSRYLLQQLMINFTDIIINFIDDNLKSLYNSKNESQMNFYTVISFINVVNTIPYLIENNAISIIKNIDFTKFLLFIEKYSGKSEIMLRTFIISISKWSSLIISNGDIIKYIKILNNLLIHNNNIYILLETCFCLNNIIKNMDNLYLKKIKINILINKDHLNQIIKTKIDWYNIFYNTTEIIYSIIFKTENIEIIKTLFELLTSLIEKCILKDAINFLDFIKKSKLLEMMIKTKKEIIEEIFRSMIKKLILKFQSSKQILEISLFYIEYLIRINE